jgi:hypothetical protein
MGDSDETSGEDDITALAVRMRGAAGELLRGRQLKAEQFSPASFRRSRRSRSLRSESQRSWGSSRVSLIRTIGARAPHGGTAVMRREMLGSGAGASQPRCAFQHPEAGRRGPAPLQSDKILKAVLKPVWRHLRLLLALAGGKQTGCGGFLRKLSGGRGG